MSRATVRKVFLTGLVVWVVGAVLLIIGASADNGQNSTLYSAGLMLAGIGGVIVIISWIMALVASAVLGRWGWFIVMLILGLIGLLPVMMILYSLVGPTQRRLPRGRAAVT